MEMVEENYRSWELCFLVTVWWAMFAKLSPPNFAPVQIVLEQAHI